MIAFDSTNPLRDTAGVTRISEITPGTLEGFLNHHGLSLQWLDTGAVIPGSHWGAPEAGIIAGTIYLRPDTPVHSVLHTACHYLCMDEFRRAKLHTDCGGTDLEESAVCYLQCLLAKTVPNYSIERMWTDMDAWGYSFRLGSARAWFEHDAADARQWLLERGLLETDKQESSVRQ